MVNEIIVSYIFKPADSKVAWLVVLQGQQYGLWNDLGWTDYEALCLSKPIVEMRFTPAWRNDRACMFGNSTTEKLYSSYEKSFDGMYGKIIHLEYEEFIDLIQKTMDRLVVTENPDEFCTHFYRNAPN